MWIHSPPHGCSGHFHMFKANGLNFHMFKANGIWCTFHLFPFSLLISDGIPVHFWTELAVFFIVKYCHCFIYLGLLTFYKISRTIIFSQPTVVFLFQLLFILGYIHFYFFLWLFKVCLFSVHTGQSRSEVSQGWA